MQKLVPISEIRASEANLSLSAKKMETFEPTITITPENGSIVSLRQQLELHADNSLAAKASNSKYAESVRANIERVETLISSREGKVEGVVMSWANGIQPVAEVVFGQSLAGHEYDEFRDYLPTVFEGISGRVRIVSIDEIFGPTLSLDLMAQQ